MTLQRLALLGAVLLASAAAHAADPHPLTGTWSWTLPEKAGKACAETWRYQPDGKRLTTSGEEVLQGTYQITSAASAAGFFRLNETTTNSNGKADCSGDVHEASDELTARFIQFSPQNDLFIVCKAESLQACFGPFRRVPG